MTTTRKRKAPAKAGARRKTPTRAPTFSVKSEGKTLMTSPFLPLCRRVVENFFDDMRSVSIRSNADGKTVAHYIYGRIQERKR